jgi:hypothetical protein
MATGSVSPKQGKIVNLPDQTITIGTATDGGTGTTVSVPFTVGSVTTGGPVTYFTATSTPGSITVNGTTSPITVSGLTTGTSYTFKVKAGNPTGYSTAGESAASNSVAPVLPPSMWEAHVNRGNSGNSVGLVTNSSKVFANAVSFTGDSPAGGTGVIVYDADGAISWQRKGRVGGAYNPAGSVGMDKANNVYFASASDQDGTNYGINTAKFNSSGTLQWQKWLRGGPAGTFLGCNQIAFDSSYNAYIGGVTYDEPYSGPSAAILYKYTGSNGTLEWQRSYRSGGAQANGSSVHCDDVNNIIYFGSYQITSPAGNYLSAWNTSGTLQWARRINTTATSNTAITTDSSGNVYYAVYGSNSGGNTGAVLMKYNSSGVLQWQRLASSNINTSTYFHVATDSSNNIYMAHSDGASTIMYVTKFDSSGNTVWSRSFTASGASSGRVLGITVNSDCYAVSFQWSSGVTYANAPMVFKLPQDGSKTGTKTINGVSVVYGDSSGTLTMSAANNSDATSGLSSGTSSLTAANGSYTITTTTDTRTIVSY